jgi:mutator protein MutT
VFSINEESRRYPTRPFLGVGALIFEHGNLLLVERAKDPLKGYWSLPGGIVEAGEKLEDAIRREVQEETGLEVESLSVFEIFERIIPDAG